MVTPQNIVTDTGSALGKTLTFKNIIVMMVLVVVVTLLISYIMKNEVTIKDDEGNIIGAGEIKPKLKFSLKN